MSSDNRRDLLRQRARGQAGSAPKPYDAIDDALIAQVQAAEQQGKAITAAADGTIVVGKFRLTATGIEMDAEITEEEADALGEFLMQIDESRQWWLGDWANSYIPANANNNEMGEIYARLAEQFGVKASTLRNYAYVCRNIPSSLRSDDLSYSHHYLLAGRDDVEALLQWASESKASVKALRERIKEIDNPPATSAASGQSTPPPSPVPSPKTDVPPPKPVNAFTGNAESTLDANEFTDAESTISAASSQSTPPPLDVDIPDHPLPEASGRGNTSPTSVQADKGSLIGKTVILPNGVVAVVEEEIEGWIGVVLQNGNKTSLPADTVDVATQAEGYICNREMVMAFGGLIEAMRKVVLLRDGADADVRRYDNALDWCEWLLGLTYAAARQIEFVELEKAISNALQVIETVSDDVETYFGDVTAQAIHEVRHALGG